ncbi:AGC protein kinase [Puccinia sorghi]|uniref:AGC protein kinase n=1 Tax=Puccinia sorghi TaxID=27349 RepID=A0A0L6UHT3_9BASI|nr:AGC protein kinase [Puccinia sorghi]
MWCGCYLQWLLEKLKFQSMVQEADNKSSTKDHSPKSQLHAVDMQQAFVKLGVMLPAPSPSEELGYTLQAPHHAPSKNTLPPALPPLQERSIDCLISEENPISSKVHVAHSCHF